MTMMTSAASAHARETRILDALAQAETTVTYRLDEALDTLVFDGCMPFGFEAQRAALCKRAARAAIRTLMAAAAPLSPEAEFLFPAIKEGRA